MSVAASDVPAPPLPIPWPPDVSSVPWWVAAFNTVVLEVVSVITLLHPGFVVPPWVQGAVPIAGQIAATVGWIVAMVIHLHLTKIAVSVHKYNAQFIAQSAVAPVALARRKPSN